MLSLCWLLCCAGCRQDHSYLLQAFRFFVKNNFLLEHAAGAPLQLPPPPEYPPAAGVQWGRPLEGDGTGDGAAEGAAAGGGGGGSQARPRDVRALLASVSEGAIDVELSDEDMELFRDVGEEEEDREDLPVQQQPEERAPAGVNSGGSGGAQPPQLGGQEEADVEMGSGCDGEEQEEEAGGDSEAEEGQLLALAAGSPTAAAAGDFEFS